MSENRKSGKAAVIAVILMAVVLMVGVTGCKKNPKDTDVKNPVKDQTEVEVPNDTDEPDTPVVDEDTSNNKYEGIDMESTLPGREWVQTTFPGVIDTPKIVIYNDETNRKTIVEEGEVVVYNESDTFAMYLPEGFIVDTSSYLVNETVGYGCCKEIDFDIEILEEEYDLWKNVDGGALYKVTLKNNGVEEELTCIISLGD